MSTNQLNLHISPARLWEGAPPSHPHPVLIQDVVELSSCGPLCMCGPRSYCIHPSLAFWPLTHCTNNHRTTRFISIKNHYIRVILISVQHDFSAGVGCFVYTTPPMFDKFLVYAWRCCGDVNEEQVTSMHFWDAIKRC